MTSLLLRLKLAKQRGEALLTEENITALPVDPFAIANKHDIVVQAKPDTKTDYRQYTEIRGATIQPS